MRRERRADDERSVAVRLTGAGSAMRARASAIPARLLCADGLDLDELTDLRETLVRLTAALTNAAQTAAAHTATDIRTEGEIDAGALHG